MSSWMPPRRRTNRSTRHRSRLRRAPSEALTDAGVGPKAMALGKLAAGPIGGHIRIQVSAAGQLVSPLAGPDLQHERGTALATGAALALSNIVQPPWWLLGGDGPRERRCHLPADWDR